MEQQEVEIPDIPQLITELQVFEYDVTSTGYVSYHAPDGFFDDCVDAFALATNTLGYIHFVNHD